MSLDVIKITANVSDGIDSNAPFVDTFTISIGVNEISTATVSFHTSNSSDTVTVKTPFDQDDIRDMRLLQHGAITGNPKELTLNIKVDNGLASGSYTFKGIVVGPSKTAGKMLIDNKLTMVSPVARINGLRPFIYNVVPVHVGELLPGTFIEQTFAETVKTDSNRMLERYLNLLNARIKAYEDNYSGTGWIDQATKEYVAQVHSANKKFLPILQSIVDSGNEDDYTSLAAIAADGGEDALNKTLTRAINSSISEFMYGVRNNFFSTLTAFCNAFQSYYVPNQLADPNDLPYGRTRPLRTMLLDDSATDLSVIPEQISLYCSDVSVDVVQQVMLTGQPFLYTGAQLENQAFPNILPEINYQTLSVYPKSVSTDSSNAVSIPCPPWLSGDVMQYGRSAPTTAGQATNHDKVDINDYISSKNAVANKISILYKNNYQNLLDEYAQSIYLDLAYSPYSLSVVVPLYLDLNVGERVNLKKNITGEKIGSGFIQKLVHTVSGMRGSLSAYTTVIVSHVIISEQ